MYPTRPIRKARHLTCAETAKLVRAALKARFPDVKFSVRSNTYTGGASIDVRWTDGPTDAAVREITDSFAGADFDGMIDLKTYRDHWLLPNGEVVLAYDPGTVGSGGVHPGASRGLPHDDAELVHFGANFVFTRREYSRGFLEEVAGDVAWEWKQPLPPIREDGAHVWIERTGPSLTGGFHDTLGDLVYREILRRTA